MVAVPALKEDTPSNTAGPATNLVSSIQDTSTRPVLWLRKRKSKSETALGTLTRHTGDSQDWNRRPSRTLECSIDSSYGIRVSILDQRKIWMMTYNLAHSCPSIARRISRVSAFLPRSKFNWEGNQICRRRCPIHWQECWRTVVARFLTLRRAYWPSNLSEICSSGIFAFLMAHTHSQISSPNLFFPDNLRVFSSLASSDSNFHAATRLPAADRATSAAGNRSNSVIHAIQERCDRAIDVCNSEALAMKQM